MRVLEDIIEEFGVDEETAIAILNCLDTMIDLNLEDSEIDDQLLLCGYIMRRLIKEDFEINTASSLANNEQDNTEIITDMRELGAEILLSHKSMARNWYFKNAYTMINFFKQGNKLGISDANTLVA